MGAVNINKLKGKIIENGLKVADVALSMGIAESSLYRKLADGGRRITIKEANDITSCLHLTPEEAMAIFFSDQVACDATKRDNRLQ